MKHTKKIFVIFAVLLVSVVFAAQSFNINRLDYYTEKNKTHFILEADSNFFYSSFKPDDKTLVVEIPGANIRKDIPRTRSYTDESGEVEGIKITDSGDKARLEIKLKKNVSHQLWMHGQNLYLDFEKAETSKSPGETPRKKEKQEKKETPVKKEKPEEKTSEPEPASEETKTKESPQKDKTETKNEEPPSPAGKLLGLRVNDSGVVIEADGKMKYSNFELSDPDRIVVDVKNVVNSMGNQNVEASDNPYVKQIRTSQFQTDPRNVSRVVLDRAKDGKYQIEEKADKIRIHFDDSKEKKAQKSSRQKQNKQPEITKTAQTETPEKTSSQEPAEKDTQTKREKTEESTSHSSETKTKNTEPKKETTSEKNQKPASETNEKPKTETGNKTEPLKASFESSGTKEETTETKKEPAAEKKTKSKTKSETKTASKSSGEKTDSKKKLTEKDYESLGMKKADKEDVTLFEAEGANPGEKSRKNQSKRVPRAVTKEFGAKTLDEGAEKYTGKPISVDFKGAELAEVFRFFSKISGLNFVLDSAVAGTLTMKLREVPWDQALDVILKNEGLGKTYENNVLRIAPAEKLAAEESKERKLKQQQELNVPLVTITRRISYAKASNLEEALDSVMSKRGEITVDERSNTMIIKDIPKKKDAILNLIDTLDVPNRQVEIESRIVETTKNFARGLGIAWGGDVAMNAAHGTTTGMNFPNSINGGFKVNTPEPGALGTAGFTFGNILGSFNLDVQLSAMENDGKGKILSSPSVTTQNNQAANIESGTQIPVVTTTATDINVEWKSASLMMEVTPQITAEDTVIMQIKVEKSRPDFSNAVQGIPSITTRSAESQVLVENGGTAVIGGIFQLSNQSSEDRVPFFHKIPGLGWMFKHKSKNVTNDELLIFITPRIMEQ